GYIYRNAHNKYFGSIDKYFSPFIATSQNWNLRTRELNDILPENNRGLVLVPQLLSNNAKDFINTAKLIRKMGYEEINLNLGCPSPTVVSKNKGSGFLAKTAELEAFLDEVFTGPEMKISIKTRQGRESHDEFEKLIAIYNKYPMEELIIHPRIQRDMYRNKPNLEVFSEALSVSRNSVCYNGDIFSVGEYNAFTARFQNVEKVMLGRGLLADPGLVIGIKTGLGLEKGALKEFHDKIYADYSRIMPGNVNVLFKMKGLWAYMINAFADCEKQFKRIRKATRLHDYEEAVAALFNECEINRTGNGADTQ
ncbi:MAG: tRNA-dihydrouridine synthase family protein, partial [Clostridiales bacterium]|nr:tRNA-dihydrouridine synthase family protein [Clostridiales bacterium]